VLQWPAATATKTPFILVVCDINKTHNLHQIAAKQGFIPFSSLIEKLGRY
jgi:hypothetical protein